MAERFYSIQPDETVFVSYNSNQHQQQPLHRQQHQEQQYHQQQQFSSQYPFAVMVPPTPATPSGGEVVCNGSGSGDCSNQQAAGGEINYFSNSTYYKSSAANVAAIDFNNNNNNQPNSMHFFDNNNNISNNNNNYLSKIPALIGGAKGKYNGDSSYLQPAVMMNGGAGAATFHATPLPLSQHQPASVPAVPSSCCHYTHNSGNGSSYYTRNRYMPYNHNRACAAAAAAAAATANNSNSMTAVQAAISSVNMNLNYQQAQQQQQQQQFAPIYKSGMNSAIAAAMATTQQTTTAASAVYERSVVSSMANAGGDPSYPPAVAALPPGEQPTSVAANLQTAGDISKVASNATCESTQDIACSPPITTAAVLSNTFTNSRQTYTTTIDPSQTITLQITNLDYSMDEASLRNFLINQLKPITPVVSLVFESSSYAKVTVPDLYFAKQVVSYLHRKKIGHKRMLVSYTRDSSLTEINTLRCQVAGLLKDVPYYTLPMYKFRELFQSRFKTSISVLDLYKMQDICSITTDSNEEKFITLQPELVNSLESSPLIKGLQHSVPYCTVHFKREHNKGWAEQEIEPLPNVSMTINEIQKVIYPLLKAHPGDIPVASLVHCIEGELNMKIKADESGVNLEHLVCCVQGIQIQVNNFGIKILGWLEVDKTNSSSSGSTVSNAQERGNYSKNNSLSDPLYQISREVIELVKMSPKSTMKFNRFIPAYHNHFGKQCRVADYGYTKLIELFEALSTVVQIMGDGENRQITLTHRTQIRRFTSDLLRILRTHGNKSVLLSELPGVFSQSQNRTFDVTDYGVCDIIDILDGLVNSNIVVVTTVSKGKDILISIPKRKQTNSEIEKTCVFAGEMVELFRNAPQYTILFQKFVRSYHYHFAYQCRLSDYGFLKLADLMDAIQGVVQMEAANDEDRKVFLSPKVAQRVFAEQCEELIRRYTGSSKTQMKLEDVLELHKKKFGYQIQAQTMGVKDIIEAIELLPYVEMFELEGSKWIICHNDDAIFRTQCYRACKLLLAHDAGGEKPKNDSIKEDNNSISRSPTTAEKVKSLMSLKDFIEQFNTRYKENINDDSVKAMKHAIEITSENEEKLVRITKFMMFLVSIVRLLEQRSSMFLYEIKNALDCNISTCFEFGYPNLFTVLAAYPDIFSVNLGVSQERSEISLLPTTELRLSAFANHQHLFGSLKLPSKQKLGRPVRNPLSEYNNNRVSSHQGPPAKTRAISSDTIIGPLAMSGYKNPYSNNNNTNINNNTSNAYSNHSIKLFYGNQQQHQQQQQQQQQQQHRQLQYQPYPPLKMPLYNGNNISYNNSSGYSSSSHQQSNMLKSSASNFNCNKENSFNTSFNTFNNSFNSTSSSNGSFSELNSSYGSIASAASNFSLKLWDRRNPNYYQGLPLNTVPPTSLPPLIMPTEKGSQQLTMVTAAATAPPPPQPLPPTATEQTTLYEFCTTAAPMCPMYEPPKPDTPPTDNMPFWIDPIWSNANDTRSNRNHTLNIKLPEFKSFNVLPMLLSPYTLSKTENLKQQVFNFDNHDRKIA